MADKNAAWNEATARLDAALAKAGDGATAAFDALARSADGLRASSHDLNERAQRASRSRGLAAVDPATASAEDLAAVEAERARLAARADATGRHAPAKAEEPPKKP